MLHRPSETRYQGRRPRWRKVCFKPRPRTATVQVSSVSTDDTTLTANLAIKEPGGSQLPQRRQLPPRVRQFSGIGCRPARVLWASGNTNADGVIVDNSGTPLETEFFSADATEVPAAFLDQLLQSPVTSRFRSSRSLKSDPQGMLTTSFLSLDHKVKDNRLQPNGRGYRMGI